MESTALAVTERAYVPTGERFDKAAYDGHRSPAKLVASEKVSVEARVRHLDKPKAPKEELKGWRLAKKDDLVLAVAMSVWAAERFLGKEESVPVGALGAA